MRILSALARAAIVPGLAITIALLAFSSCGREVTAPVDAARIARGLAFDPQFPAALQLAGDGASALVPFDRVRVLLRRGDGTAAVDTMVRFPVGGDSLRLDLTAVLSPGAPAAGEAMSMSLAYINVNGDTVFRGGPTPVLAVPTRVGQPRPRPVQVPLRYTGPGADATLVRLSPRSAAAFTGDGFAFTAVASDALGRALPGTPVVWSSLDPLIATLGATSGNVVAQTRRGVARIAATLLTGQSDTVTLLVRLRASALTMQSGSGQAGDPGTLLGQPLVVRAVAADGIGVAGVPVTFGVVSGGGSLGATSVLTDSAGDARTTWRLGVAAGAQAVNAVAAGLTGSPVAFSATSIVRATRLVVSAQPVNGAPLLPLAAVVVTARDDNGNVATSFTGTVSIGLGTNPGNATLGGATAVNATAGVATFTGLTVSAAGIGYTLVATSTGLGAATSNAFDIVTGAADRLVFAQSPANTVAGEALTPLRVTAQDAQGNTLASFSGAVQITLAANPSGGSLLGAAIANAVAGSATFPGLAVSRPGLRYQLAANAAGLAGATSLPFDIALGPAALLALAGGGGQVGVAGAPLPLPIVVRVTDQAGNPVAGVSVSFAIASGGGSVAPASATTSALGLASSSWTLGALVGTQGLNMSSAGLSPSPLMVTATATGVAGGPLGIGTTSASLGMRQSSGPTGSYVFTPTNVAAPLVVNLLSTGTAQVTVPPSVTIATGTNLAFFATTAQDATGTVQVQATAAGYAGASMNVQVTQPKFILSTSTPVSTGSPPQVITVCAYDQLNSAHYVTENVSVTLGTSNGAVASIDLPTVMILSGTICNSNAKWTAVGLGSATLTASDQRGVPYAYASGSQNVFVPTLASFRLALPAIP